MRAIAVVMVMVFHMAQQAERLTSFISPTKTGVDLFFALSGFLITGILLKSNAGDWHEVRTFYVRRALRIFPLYYAYLALLAIVGTPISLCFLIYTQNFFITAGVPVFGPNHLWSLAVEEQFYLVWPFIVLFLPRRMLMKVLVGVIAFAFLIRIPMYFHGLDPYYFTPSRIDALACGGVIALLLYQGKLARARPVLFVLFVLGIVITLLEAATANRFPHLEWIQLTKYSVLAMLYASAIGLLVTGAPQWIALPLKSRPFRFVGRISYGLYVFHPTAFYVAHRYLVPEGHLILLTIAGFALAFALALTSWYGMERYMVSLKDRFAPERTRFPNPKDLQTL